MNTKHCQICWKGETIGEFMGTPMCKECLSPMIDIGKLDKFNRNLGGK